MKPRRGLRIEHARLLDPRTPPADRVPDLCTVSAVRKGTVYFTTVTGMKVRTDLATFPEIVGKVITAFHDAQG